MRLSIGMIVKNEEKYLERCLLALGKLRREVDCELIIVDTGSTDATVEIAKRFTDKVYHFEWCNDFAAARNETLRYATGEWYMALDADEIFVDTDEIIGFMNSDERHNWVSASFRIENFGTQSKLESTMFDAVRLVKRADDLHYEGIIHEHFVSKSLGIDDTVQNCFRLMCVAEHFGYIVDDGVMGRKSERNRELLYSEFEQRKNEAFYYTQLYDLEYGTKDYEKAAEYALRCIELSENESENAVGYMLYLKILNILGKSEEVVCMAEKYFAQERTFEHLCDVSVYMNRGLARFRLKDWHGAIADFERYFSMVEHSRNAANRESYIHPIEDLTVECFIIRFLECAVAYEQIGDTAGLSRLLKSADPSIFDQKLTMDIDYARDYVAHAVLLAVQGGDRSAADYIAQNGTDRQRRLLHEIIEEATGGARQTEQSEFEQYAAQIKDTIRSLISGGMKQQAIQLLAQYKQLCPDDAEIHQLEAMINI